MEAYMLELADGIKTLIYLISSRLFYPVLVLLLLVFGYIVYATGAFVAAWLERRRLCPCDPEALRCWLVQKNPSSGLAPRVERYANSLKSLAHTFGDRSNLLEAAVESLLQQESLKCYKSIHRLRILVRVAPALGLIGTLIPMGSGLKALGQGNLAGLSDDLVVAFTTTVVGLTVGIVAFFISAVKRRWIEQDINTMELISEMLVMPTERRTYAIHQETSDGAGAKMAG